MGPWPNDPLGPQARASADIYWIMFVCAIIVLAIVDGGLIYAGLKFRDRPGHIAKQFHGHNFLELLWTVVPTIMVISFSDSMQLTFAARDRLIAGQDKFTAFKNAVLVVGPACVLTHTVTRSR